MGEGWDHGAEILNRDEAEGDFIMGWLGKGFGIKRNKIYYVFCITGGCASRSKEAVLGTIRIPLADLIHKRTGIFLIIVIYI